MSLTHRLKRPIALASAAVLTVAALTPSVLMSKAHAYGLLGSRFVQISSSKVSDTNVAYQIGFNVTTSASVGGVVVEFCSNSPIVGDSCTAPAGLDLNTGTATITPTLLSGFAVDASSTANKLVYTNATPQSLTSGNSVTITIGDGSTNGVTNPSATGTFYARLLTYDTSAHAVAYPVATGQIDAGGAAMSTADQIQLQAKVQERLTFCVYTGAVVSSNCTVSTTNPVTLGDANGVLSSSAASISNTAKYNITTNASNGATVRAKGDTLKTGSFSIDPVGTTPGDGAAVAYATNKEQFGLCTYTDSGSTDAATLAATAPYNDAGCSGLTTGQSLTQAQNSGTPVNFAFNSSEMTGTYGSAIAQKGAGDFSTGDLVFLGGVSNTTEPGIYTTTMSFIATGNY